MRGTKELAEKLGRNDPCPCGSGRRFKRCCLEAGRFRWSAARLLLLETSTDRPASGDADGRGAGA
ncbi:MAG: SEC-C domain-containing protein [Bacteroidetes bacterium]|nr:SEC-C domain-containing protein [Bacteroidota bacterium]